MEKDNLQYLIVTKKYSDILKRKCPYLNKKQQEIYRFGALITTAFAQIIGSVMVHYSVSSVEAKKKLEELLLPYKSSCSNTTLEEMIELYATCYKVTFSEAILQLIYFFDTDSCKHKKGDYNKEIFPGYPVNYLIYVGDLFQNINTK